MQSLLLPCVLFTVAAAPAPLPEAPPLFDGLGSHSRPATRHREAQRYCDQGLAFLFAFNHDEALRAFAYAAVLDPSCALAHWGVAQACGPHINKPDLPAERAEIAISAIRKASRLKTSPAEAALVAAAAKRFASGEKEYAAAMKAAAAAFPKDADIGALYAESLMNLRPWDLYDRDGKPRPETPLVVAELERVMKMSPDHPLALHLYLHAVEASPTPSRGLKAADRLRALQPGLAHMVHMPSHIDVRCGLWLKAVEANAKAVAADEAYRERSPRQGFYRLYIAHNRHMLAFAAMMAGREEQAISSVRKMVAEMPADWLASPDNAAIADGFVAAPLEVLTRFGRWKAVLAEPEPAAAFPVARAMRLHARAVALAAMHKPAEARREQAAFVAAVKRVPAEARVGNNLAADLLAAAGHMLEGEILVREGKTDAALAALRKAVAAEDELRYDEPPGRMLPSRHALGAFLLKAGKAAEAEAVYRADLARWPDNLWSLTGLAASLRVQGKADAAKSCGEKLRAFGEFAETAGGTSCLCEPGK